MWVFFETPDRPTVQTWTRLKCRIIPLCRRGPLEMSDYPTVQTWTPWKCRIIPLCRCGPPENVGWTFFGDGEPPRKGTSFVCLHIHSSKENACHPFSLSPPPPLVLRSKSKHKAGLHQGSYVGFQWAILMMLRFLAYLKRSKPNRMRHFAKLSETKANKANIFAFTVSVWI